MVTLINSAEPQITRQPELIPRKVPIVRAGTSRIDTTDTITETGDQPPVPLRKSTSANNSRRSAARTTTSFNQKQQHNSATPTVAPPRK